MWPRASLLIVLALAAPLTGCVGPNPCDPPLDLEDTIVESTTDGEVTYRVTVDGGPSNAGRNMTLSGYNDIAGSVEGTTGTLDSEGKLTMRVTLPRDWARAELRTRDAGPSEFDCGTKIVNPELDAPMQPVEDEPMRDPPKEDEKPPEEKEPTPPACTTSIAKIETDREHYTGESDAIYRVHVNGNVSDGARVRGTVNGAPVEGEVVNGVAELRHRVHSYGDYTLTSIEIVADGCTHDHEKDAQTSATANVN